MQQTEPTIQFKKYKNKVVLSPKKFLYQAPQGSYVACSKEDLERQYWREFYEFEHCTNLEHIVIPENMKKDLGYIDKKRFDGSESLHFSNYGFYIYETDDVDIVLIPHFKDAKVGHSVLGYEWYYINRKSRFVHKGVSHNVNLHEVLDQINKFEANYYAGLVPKTKKIKPTM